MFGAVFPRAMAIFLHAQKPSIDTRLTDLPSNFIIPRYCDEELNYQKEKSLLLHNLSFRADIFDQNLDIFNDCNILFQNQVAIVMSVSLISKEPGLAQYYKPRICFLRRSANICKGYVLKDYGNIEQRFQCTLHLTDSNRAKYLMQFHFS